MIKRLFTSVWMQVRAWRLYREQQGAALLMVLALMALAVPVSVAALHTASQLNRNSQAFNSRLEGMYNASAGIEAVLYEILNAPDFDDDLTPEDPDKEVEVPVNDEIITVNVTKLFTAAQVEGQALVVTKEVTPATAPVDTPTTFTYTIHLKNEGTDSVTLRRIFDYLPPGLDYVDGSTGGLTTDDPSVRYPNPNWATCGSVPQELEWNVESESIVVGQAQEITLTFQATGTLSDGTYYNQASARYTPWWDSLDVYVFSPYTAEITVGSGDPKCGHKLQVVASSEVDPPVPEPGVEQDFTYTISVENISPDEIYVCGFKDTLPPDFTYKFGSAGTEPDNIATFEPQEVWLTGPERWELRWEDGGEVLATIGPGETKTQVFVATATPVSGVNYYNEFRIEWATELKGNGDCHPGNGNGGSGTSQGGAGQTSSVDSPILYDVASVAEDGTILSRVVYYESAGEVEILSWQEY